MSVQAVRHRASTKAMVVELRAAGWGAAEIRRILTREGISPVPTLKTIRVWTDERYARLQRDRNRVKESASMPMTFRWPGVRSAEWRVRRIKVLAGVGLSCEAIAKVMSHDFPDAPLSAAAVRGVIDHDRMPNPLRRLK